MAQQVTRASADYINEETVGKVIYGDTDSCYISWPDEWSIEECLQHTEEVVEELNNNVYPELASDYGMEAEQCKWEMEIEDASEVMFQSGRKKRYSKNVVWVEGMDFDERLVKV
jgi:DNA polymerase I